jgi:glycosyltransferase involved in cell wall biosynthesis
MPSLAEGFGLTGFEGVAAGRPVLITQESGLAEWLIQLEDSGRISGFKDACIAKVIGAEAARIDEWTDKLTKLLLDPNAASERALALREKLKTEFTWDRAASEVAREFQELSPGAATGEGEQ